MPQNQSLWLINSNGHYFEIDSELRVPKHALRDCTFFDSRQALYQHVCEQHGLQFDEVNETEIRIRLYRGKPHWLDSRGIMGAIDSNVADFICSFEV